MAEALTLKKFSTSIKKSPNEILEILKAAGIGSKKESDIISHEEKMRIVEYLSKSKKSASHHRLTSQVQVMRGKGTKTVSVEIRSARTKSKTEVAETPLKPTAIESSAAKKVENKTIRKKAEQLTIPKIDTADNIAKNKKSSAESSKKKPIKSTKVTAETASSTAKPASKTKPISEKTPKQKRKKLSIARDKSGQRTIKRLNRQSLRVVPPQKHGFEKPTQMVKRELIIPKHISVIDLAQGLAIKSSELIKKMMSMGVMTTINQSLDQDTAVLIIEELGHQAVIEKDDDAEAKLVDNVADEHIEKATRPPVVVVMGHVDHGKTSLLDYIRNSKVHSGEVGGITQHIGAYHVETDKGVITFLDTPGHAAFTAMRVRGAKVTDIAILVVAADDGVMPQTVEAIEHAQAAEVPVIVALTKIDKEGTDREKIRAELAKYKIVPEAWGGDNIFVEVSSKTGQGIDQLLDAISLQAEIMELKASLSGNAQGSVIEAALDKGRGVITTLLIRQGILNKGDILLAGTEFGRVRALVDEDNRSLSKASPAIPIRMLGFSGAPSAGDEFVVVETERRAKEIADRRRQKQRDKQQITQTSVIHLENFMQSKVNVMRSIDILLKADTRGTAEAIQDSLSKIISDEVNINILSTGVGGINVSDVNLAAASKAWIVGFNVRADVQARREAEAQHVAIHYYSIIYELINSITETMSGMLAPTIKEEIIGIAQVKDTFRSSKLGTVAGCQVIEGTVRRGNPIRVLRENIVIFEGELESLRRFKEDAKEVKVGLECGIAVKDYNDVKLGDQIEIFQRTEIMRTL